MLFAKGIKNMAKEVRCLSLFAGIGGFEVGMSPLGFRFTNTLEWDENCCITLNANKNLTGALEDEIKPVDITKTEPQDFSQEKVDYIVGGPPCQSFSAAGRRAGGVAGTSDARGTLFWYYCQYVKYFQPKAFLFENVRGILSSKKGEDFKIICASFEEVGYKLYWRILNAADYGVPQRRERVFLVGIRNDLDIAFKFPRPTHGPDSPDNKPYVMVREALKDITDENEVVPPYGGKYGDLLPDIPVGENYRFYTEEMGHPHPIFAWRSKFSNFLYKLDPDDLCKTIIAYQGRYDGPFHWHNRKCTVEELKRLQGFPADYNIPQKYSEGVKQIGNSVCPPVARQIGMALRYQVEGLEEFKVPLLNPDDVLSFDKAKGKRAKKTHEKKVAKVANDGQMSIFDYVKPANSYHDEHKHRKFKGHDITWDFVNGELLIYIDRESHHEDASIDLNFFGGVTTELKRIKVESFSDEFTDEDLTLMWNEIHRAISEYTTYDSLMPLYGHFTEPYPKFIIKFSSDSSNEAVEFQKIALDEKYRTKILSFTKFPIQMEDYEEYFEKMRKCGFDVRTNKTNRTVPMGHFRICYPFTLPSDWKDKTPWNNETRGE
jgi:DNA (cytosine-5)-methyltransferase 1